ncbi:tryptophan synthase [Purpureocillium lavendulum]|uniref:Tryptophan synthase n=1 Tax=Purpureocillium lavendulum TaxID=1247861 RepID=A0AB34FRB3_9HYPO|nr:tryptophan synthase [Purpureocillium lavendulum]
MSRPSARYEIRGWDTGNDQFDINIGVNGVHFAISLSSDCFIGSPLWACGEQVADIFLPEFERLAPVKVHSGKLTLAGLAVRGSFECRYRVIQEKADMRSAQDDFPLFDPIQVQVPYRDGHSIHDIIPRQVFIQDQTFFYKSCWSPCDAIDEVEKYCRIHKSGLSVGQLSTARLFGIVAGRQGLAKGLLYHWIETRPGARTLFSVVDVDTPLSLLEKWASQIRAAVAGLHRLGIVWGDAKPHNVLIDTNDNAIVIDLEGGTTRGWFDHDVGGSIEGDLQGLERIIDFIFNDESPLRLGRKGDVELSDSEFS